MRSYSSIVWINRIRLPQTMHRGTLGLKSQPSIRAQLRTKVTSSTEILRCREMTRCASCGLMQRSKKSIIRLSCRRAIRAPCGNFKADRPRGLEIDDQLEVRRLLDRYIGTLGSAQNFSRQSCPLSQELGEPRTIANLCITANLAANVAVGS
jgi:hypothetical protein